jgi:flagellin-like hook-associated protein FlgL
MSGAMSLLHSTQAQNDIRRIMREMTDLHRQVASGAKANDLAGFGSASSQLLSAQSLRASAESRSSMLNQLDARLSVQASALGEVAGASTRLALTIREAISANDGRGIVNELEMTFRAVVSGLNESWNGQPLFAGERQTGSPIKISEVDQLAGANSDAELFDEAERRQTYDIGDGPPVTISLKASELSSGLFSALHDLKVLLDVSGGQIGQPIDNSQTQNLQNIAARLESEAARFNTEEGRVGLLQARFADERARLQQRADIMSKEIGEHADADLAQVSIRLSALMVQYEAAAKTFSDLSQLSLLRYL